MEIQSLRSENFRNLDGSGTEFHPGLNLIVGDNGQGKTSLLEAIAFVAGRATFRVSSFDDVISSDGPTAIVAGRVERKSPAGVDGASSHLLGVRLGNGRREHFLNGERSTQLRARSLLPSVFLTAVDLGRITGSPSGRRAAIDRVAFALEPGHAAHVRNYDKARASKTRLLADGSDRESLGAFEQVMAEAGAQVSVSRRKAIHKLDRIFRQNARKLGSPFPNLSLRLQSDLSPEGEARDFENALQEGMKKKAAEERQRHRCLFGPHRDDVEILNGSRPIGSRASSGENRTLVLAWTLAEADLLQEVSFEPPLVAVDDFDSDWDPTALDRFAQALPEGTQLFLTSARPDAVRGLPLPPGCLFRVRAGHVVREGDLGGGCETPTQWNKKEQS